MIRIGTAGWSYKDWVGIVYPAKSPRGFDRLGWMASTFDTSEVNSTFYRIPTPRMTRDWARRVEHNPRFAFTAKLYRGFTHEREAGGREAEEFLAAMDPLVEAGRLGCVLIQYPMSFHNTPESRGLLDEVLERFRSLPLAAEFRHRSWDSPETLELLRSHRTAFVNIDQPRFKDTLPATNHVTAPIAYYRLHGRNWEKWFNPNTSNEERYNYLYSQVELTPWAERIRDGAARASELEPSGGPAPRESAPGAYAILNNHFRGQAVANAIELQRALTGGRPAVPATLLETYPTLRASVASASASQAPLFSER